MKLTKTLGKWKGSCKLKFGSMRSYSKEGGKEIKKIESPTFGWKPGTKITVEKQMKTLNLEEYSVLVKRKLVFKEIEENNRKKIEGEVHVVNWIHCTKTYCFHINCLKRWNNVHFPTFICFLFWLNRVKPK